MIPVKTKEEIEIIAEGGKMLAGITKELVGMVRPGIATIDLDRAAKALILKLGGTPSFLGYEGFPASLCASVNEQIVHTVPGERILKEGDILTIDIGMKYKGFHTDMAVSVPVGKVSERVEKMIKVTKEALEEAIIVAKAGNKFGDIGYAIQKCVESNGFAVVRDLCSHGIGRELHEDPQILNYGKRGQGETILEGMVFCIEPMITDGDYRIKKSKDGYTYETKDGSLSCHFEHTLAATKTGCIVLTEL